MGVLQWLWRADSGGDTWISECTAHSDAEHTVTAQEFRKPTGSTPASGSWLASRLNALKCEVTGNVVVQDMQGSGALRPPPGRRLHSGSRPQHWIYRPLRSTIKASSHYNIHNEHWHAGYS